MRLKLIILLVVGMIAMKMMKKHCMACGWKKA
jgi:hypothetical protein